MTGHFLRDNCPSYLVESHFDMLKSGKIEGLQVDTAEREEREGRERERMCVCVCLMDYFREWQRGLSLGEPMHV
jgi:hypothetical protein